MARSSKAAGNMMMMGDMFAAIYSGLYGGGPSINKAVSSLEPRYNVKTGSFNQNRRKELKKSWCRKVKCF